MRIPYLDLKKANAAIMKDLAAAATRVIASGWYILGEEVANFEESFALHCGASHAVGVGNGLDALRLINQALGLGEGSRVAVPTNTYIATWLAVSTCGAEVVPIEPDPLTENLSANSVVDAFTSNDCNAAIVVHLFGRPANVIGISEKYNRDGEGPFLIEDAAQAHGSAIGKQRTGSLGDAAAFSFYPTKNLGAIGDAGVITTNSDQIFHRVKLLRNYGSREKYFHEVIGFNSRIDEIQAAFLSVKLKCLDGWNARRREIADYYFEALRNAPGLLLPAKEEAGTTHTWHVFSVHHERRDELQKLLVNAGIGTLIFYPQPPHLSQAYRNLGYARGDFPIAENLADTALALPIAPYMTEKDCASVANAVLDATIRLS